MRVTILACLPWSFASCVVCGVLRTSADIEYAVRIASVTLRTVRFLCVYAEICVNATAALWCKRRVQWVKMRTITKGTRQKERGSRAQPQWTDAHSTLSPTATAPSPPRTNDDRPPTCRWTGSKTAESASCLRPRPRLQALPPAW